MLPNEVAPEGVADLRGGAAGVIARRASGERLVDAVKPVAADARMIPSDQDVPPPAEPAVVPAIPLPEREEQELGQISHRLTHRQLAPRLGVSPRAVDAYRKRIRVKLGLGNKMEPTRGAVLGELPTQCRDGSGLVPVPPVVATISHRQGVS